jgi:hypothetical protein
MTSTTSYAPKVWNAPYWDENPELIVGNIYAYTNDQYQTNNESRFMILTEIDYSIIMDDGSVPIVGISWGKPWTDPDQWTLKEWGMYNSDLILDYTKYCRENVAAHRIQSQWRLYRQRKAVKKIENAFLTWKHRKNNDWNPRTFMGVINMMLDYLRLTK